uniref:Uncharacterized protein n=1 Tax=Arundo donax TaxID=35708 RepID=A0A0A9HQI2_ARUDO
MGVLISSTPVILMHTLVVTRMDIFHLEVMSSVTPLRTKMRMLLSKG